MDASSPSCGASGCRRLPAEPQLFCLGGEDAYAELGAALSPDLRAVGICLAARGARESIERITARYVCAIRERQPSGPYRLLGFSFSGVLAYEAACQLVQADEAVSAVAVLDVWLPGAVARSPAAGLRGHAGRVRRRWLAPAAVRDAVALEHTQLRAIRRYRAKPYDGWILLARAQATVDSLGAELRDATYGWGRHARRLELIDLPGDHTGILRAPGVRVLAAALRGSLR